MNNQAYKSQYPTCPVTTSHEVKLNGVVKDPLLLTCRWPENTPPKAVVIFCHGLGAGGQDYAQLSTELAANGYFVVHPTFPDWIGAVAAAYPDLGIKLDANNRFAWLNAPKVREQMFKILHSPSYWMERTLIVRQLLNGLDAILTSTCGRPKQPIPTAIAGHSFGAYTAQLFAGAEIDVPNKGKRQYKDKRLSAAILLSAQGRDQQGLREGSWDQMTGPVLNVTGTLDGGAKGQDWHWKCEPYHQAPAGDKYLAVLDNADHYLGGMTPDDPNSGIPNQSQAVTQLSLAFLDAYLQNDLAAKLWLAAISDHIGDCKLLFEKK
ncbi:MAG: alpha/beta fold hydrolase [Alphaproteobacteria bacterium]|nr:alpha/beta fold hydrolase [Alphaproteobacteria bacterium]